MNLTRENTVAVIIDIQSKLLPYIAEADKLIDANIRLIKGLRILGIPLIVTEQYPKGLGFTDAFIQEALGESYKPILKDTFSCARSEEFMKALDNCGRENVIITGIESHICVLQTIVDLCATKYKPMLIANCVSSRSLVDKKYGIKRMLQEGANIGTYESALMELTENSKDSKFKEISSIIK